MSQNKHNIIIFLLALLLLYRSNSISARQLLVAQNQGDEKGVDASNKMSQAGLLKEPKDHELMGLEEYCEEGDNNEDCQKRRMTAEAHLDYIYTQHHKDSTTTP